MCYMNCVHCIYLMLLAIGLNKIFLIPDSLCGELRNDNNVFDCKTVIFVCFTLYKYI